jgi:hypothetical protein
MSGMRRRDFVSLIGDAAAWPLARRRSRARASLGPPLRAAISPLGTRVTSATSRRRRPITAPLCALIPATTSCSAAPSWRFWPMGRSMRGSGSPSASCRSTRTIASRGSSLGCARAHDKAGTASCIGSDMSIVGKIDCNGPAQNNSLNSDARVSPLPGAICLSRRRVSCVPPPGRCRREVPISAWLRS